MPIDATYISQEETKWERLGFSIIKVVGFGENSKYNRVCDTVIRNSRLFKKMYTEWVLFKSEATKQKNRATRYKRELAESKKETKEFTRFADKEVKALQLKISRQQKEIEGFKKTIVTLRNAKLWERKEKKKSTKKVFQLQKEKSLLINHDRFFTEPLFMRSVAWSPAVRAEMMLRALISFKQFERSNTVTFLEFLILATGLHTKAFNKEDLYERFDLNPKDRVLHVIKTMVERDLLKRLERKELYYVTEKGKVLITKIVKHLESAKMKTYWGNTFDDVKIEHRNLSIKGSTES